MFPAGILRDTVLPPTMLPSIPLAYTPDSSHLITWLPDSYIFSSVIVVWAVGTLMLGSNGSELHGYFSFTPKRGPNPCLLPLSIILWVKWSLEISFIFVMAVWFVWEFVSLLVFVLPHCAQVLGSPEQYLVSRAQWLATASENVRGSGSANGHQRPTLAALCTGLSPGQAYTCTISLVSILFVVLETTVSGAQVLLMDRYSDHWGLVWP